MARFFLPPDAWTSAPALTGDEAKHFSQVLRGKAGESITVFDGQGRRATARVGHVSRDAVSLELGDVITRPAFSPSIVLAQAILKGKNMDLVVQKAVELGVSAIQPLMTRNTVVQPGGNKAEKWRRTALEACKQCGQDQLPHIFDPAPIQSWLNQSRSTNSLQIIASLADGAFPLKEKLRISQTPPAIVMLVGPEGDFTGEETRFSIAQGFQPVTLGPTTLRSETAAIYCLSAAIYEFR